MTESSIQQLNKQLQQQKLLSAKEKAIFQQKLSQYEETITQLKIKCESYKESHTLLIKVMDEINPGRFGEFYSEFNNGVGEVKRINEKNIEKMMEGLNKVLTYVQVS